MNMKPIRRRGEPATIGARVALCAAALVVVSTEALTASFDGPVETTRAALEQWVETRRLISQEKRDWAEDKEVLTARIDLVRREIETMRAKVGEAEVNVVETDRRREELVQENDALRTVTQSLGDVIAGLEKRTRELLPRLPPPIRERVKALSQRLPEDSAATKATLSERFQNVVGILNEVDKFNRDVALSLEVRELPNGGAVEVTTLYLGIGQGYYASANGAAAGYGSSTSDGWVWSPDDGAATAILDAIAVQKNESPAHFVQVPLSVDRGVKE